MVVAPTAPLLQAATRRDALHASVGTDMTRVCFWTHTDIFQKKKNLLLRPPEPKQTIPHPFLSFRYPSVFLIATLLLSATFSSLSFGLSPLT
jgi:hypothetical protein